MLQPIFVSAHGSKSKNVVDTQHTCDLFMFTHPLFVNLSSLKCLLIIPESIFAKLWQLLRGVYRIAMCKSLAKYYKAKILNFKFLEL